MFDSITMGLKFSITRLGRTITRVLLHNDACYQESKLVLIPRLVCVLGTGVTRGPRELCKLFLFSISSLELHLQN